MTKGAPHIIIALLADDQRGRAVREVAEARVRELGARGIRALAVAYTEEEGGEVVAGCGLTGKGTAHVRLLGVRGTRALAAAHTEEQGGELWGAAGRQ